MILQFNFPAGFMEPFCEKSRIEYFRLSPRSPNQVMHIKIEILKIKDGCKFLYLPGASQREI